MFAPLTLPLMCAPMSFASSVPLAAACCGAGIIGGWQGGTFTSLGQFEEYLQALASAGGAPPIVNLPARIATEPAGEAKLELLERYRAPLVLISAGNPGGLVDRVQGWGGRVIQDVTTMRHAEKAIDAGVDGLMLTCAGAGGHTGFLTPFAFVPAVRRIWDGLMIVGGGIADVHGIAAVLALGGDIACMGTRFIATPESGVADAHRRMISQTRMDGIVISAAMNGIPANWIKTSLEHAGLDVAALPDHRITLPAGMKPWRDIFSAGQSVGLIDSVEPVVRLVARFREELSKIVKQETWRARLATLDFQ